jgi:hypothetical protein
MINNAFVQILIFLLFILITSSIAQIKNEIIDKLYLQTIKDESHLDSLGNYTYTQKINFTKLDGDGEIDTQSKRDYVVYVRGKNLRNRDLISAYDYEDGEWIEVTEKEKNKKGESDTQSQKFSLAEMLSPEKRDEYRFKFLGNEPVNGYESIHLYAEPYEKDEEKFAGDLWFEKETYGFVKARLIPSDNPTGVNEMIMEFNMARYGNVWLPKKITFEAQVSFLIIFKGSVFSEILFENYKFDQSLPDSLF